jgi:acyl carrier protein
MSESNLSNATRVKKALAESLKRKTEDLDDEIALVDLVAESFALIETVINLQEDLSIRLVQEDLRDVKTVGELVRVCAARL